MKRSAWLPKANRVALVAAALALVAGVAAYRRGMTLSPPGPASSVAEGARCGLVAPERVRCVAVAHAPVARVWQLVTDYPKFPELFSSRFVAFEVLRYQPESDERARLSGAVVGFLQRWPFEVQLTHHTSAESSTASWEQISGVLARDRGSWTLRPRSSTETSISYEIEVRMKGVPRFLINDLLLDSLPAGIEQLVDAAAKGTP